MVDRGDVRKSNGGVKSPLPTAIATVCISWAIGGVGGRVATASRFSNRISSLPRSAPRPCAQAAPIWGLPLTSTSRFETSIR